MPHVTQRHRERPCPYCRGREVTKAGKRYNRSGTVQLYKCNHCTRKFRDHAAHNTTYPIHAIIETLSLYNRGYTLEESARRAGKRHRTHISRQTAATWVQRYAKHFPYLKIRANIASRFAPHSLVTEARLHHGQVYVYDYAGLTEQH